MRALARLLLPLILAIACLPCLAPEAAAAAASQDGRAVAGPCDQGTLPGGALSLICVPTSGWNGDLVLFAHGYVPANQPLGFYELTLPDGTYLPALVQGLGYAFATTSYRENGLAVLPALDDVRQLIAAFPATAGKTPVHTFLTGVSEGGLITTLFAEQSPNLISGALAGCGPIGNFQFQVDYIGDFRVLFDYFFPGVLPPSPVLIPPSLMDNWSSTYEPAVTAAINAAPLATRQLITTSQAAIDPANPATSAATTATDVLWYDVFATNDASGKLGGNPYGNRTRIYRGSLDDPLLNLRIERFSASPTALQSVGSYQTTGNLTIPLVTIHTTGDDVIPFWHEDLYRKKVHLSGAGRLTQFPVAAYGHCNFTTAQVLLAFDALVHQVTG